MRKTESRENPQGILCQFMTVFFCLSTNVGKLEYKVRVKRQEEQSIKIITIF